MVRGLRYARIEWGQAVPPLPLSTGERRREGTLATPRPRGYISDAASVTRAAERAAARDGSADLRRRQSMNRRQFLKATAAAGAAAAFASTVGFGPYVAYAADRKPRRVGLIGSGWY